MNNFKAYLPSFFVLGAQKAGTTTLHHRLLTYPEVSLPITKETHFFSNDEKFQRGYDWYLEQFKKLKPGGIRGEIAPDYMFSEAAAKRISNCLEAPKLIFMLRHPIDRAYSNYLMSCRQGREERSFFEALLDEKKYFNEPLDLMNKKFFSYMARGEYSKQIQVYKKYFPKSPLHFVLFEDFIDSTELGTQTYKNIISFIGLNRYLPPDFTQKENVASQPRVIWLRDFLYGSTGLKRLLGKAIPSRTLREAFAYRLDMMNQKPNAVVSPAIPKFVMEWCEKEKKALTELTGINVSKWDLITSNYVVKNE